MDINFSAYADGQYQTYPAGTYKVRLDKWEKCTAKGTGNPQVKWSGTIVMPGEYEGSPVTDFLSLSEAAGWRIAWFTKEALNMSKEQMKEVGKLNTGSERFSKLMNMAKGRTMWWVLILDPKYNNNKVKEFIPDEEMEPIDLADLDDIPSFVKQKDIKQKDIPEVDLDTIDPDKI